MRLAVLSAILLAACGGGGGNTALPDARLPDAATGDTPDAQVVADARPAADAASEPDGTVADARLPADAGPDAGPMCSVASDDWGALGALAGSATFFAGEAGDPTDDILSLSALLEAGLPADGLQLDLFAGFGAFSGGTVEPGTYELTGDELDYASCGVCLRLFTNVDEAGDFEDVYMPVSGTVTLTATGADLGQRLTGTLTNVVFQHVRIDPSTLATTPVDDTCSTAIASASFDGELAAP